jgi:hypothetical protein
MREATSPSAGEMRMKRCLALCILAFAIGWLSGAGLSYYRAAVTTPDPEPIPYSVWKQMAAEAESALMLSA